jgi:hypothetical protein
MPSEMYIFPVELNLEPDSIENCEMLFEVLGAIAISVSEEYPGMAILPVYEVSR